MWGSRQFHSASDRSVRYVLLMHARVALQTLDYPFLDSFRIVILRTSPLRRSPKSTQPRSNTYGCRANGPGLRAFLLACALSSRESKGYSFLLGQLPPRR
jgi:hypothetical protein